MMGSSGGSTSDKSTNQQAYTYTLSVNAVPKKGHNSRKELLKSMK